MRKIDGETETGKSFDSHSCLTPESSSLERSCRSLLESKRESEFPVESAVQLPAPMALTGHADVALSQPQQTHAWSQKSVHGPSGARKVGEMLNFAGGASAFV